MDENHKKLHADTEFFTKAQVHREKVDNAELSEFCNHNLRRLGALTAPNEHWEHLGSYATHIFKPKNVDSYAFVHQNALTGLDEVIVSKSLTDLKGTLMESFGRTRPTKRSGF